jgi:GT2 family glycosyltransferase
MPTAVLDLDFHNLPSEITVPDRYSRALILIRYRGVPVGKAYVPVVDGRIDGRALSNLLVESAGWPLCERWLCDYLEWDGASHQRAIHRPATIAICSRDRTEELKRCLSAIERLPDDGQETLVIDNASKTDATMRLVQSFPRVRYVREERAGLDIARNRALLESNHEIVAFLDDDAIPDPNWLRALLRNFDDPRVLCVTGLTMPLELETEAQEWFERYSPFARGFTRRIYDRINHSPMGAGRVGAGANMALRRHVSERVGPFDERLDAGTPTHSGGDTEMFSRILRAGYRIVYDPAALNWHRHRRTWDGLRRTVFGYGVGVYAFWTRSLLIEREFTVLKEALVWFFYQIKAVLRSLLRRRNWVPLNLLLAELAGCAYGPLAYFLSSRGR